FYIASLLGVQYFHHTIALEAPQFSDLIFLKFVILAGIFFGLLALLLIELMKITKRAFALINDNLLRAAIGGLILLLLTIPFSTTYLGLGTEQIESAVKGQPQEKGGFLLKMLFTSITLASGGSGGVIGPIFFVGASAGSLFAEIFKANISLFAGIGIVALLAAATNTPIAAAIMAIELFGPQIGVFAALAAFVSFIIVGHKSIYPSQVIGAKKSDSLQVTGRDVREAKVDISSKGQGVLHEVYRKVNIPVIRFRRKRY
ncbi:MAG: chloride channel protein, partial [Nanoarchaeota archaeon]